MRYIFSGIILLILCSCSDKSRTDYYIDYTFNDGWGLTYSIIIEDKKFYLLKKDDLKKTYYKGILNNDEIRQIGDYADRVINSQITDTIFKTQRLDQPSYITFIEANGVKYHYYSYGEDNTPKLLLNLDSVLFDVSKAKAASEKPYDTVINFKSNGEGILWPKPESAPISQ